MVGRRTAMRHVFLQLSSARVALAASALCFLGSVPGCSSEAEASEEASPPAAVAQASEAEGTTYDPRTSLAPMIKAVGPAVVSIRAQGRRDVRGFFGTDSHITRGSGSGFAITSDGLIVTNHHVIEGAEQLEVALHDGQKFSARVVGSDPETDLAVLQLEGAKDLPVVEFADSKALEVGDWVVAIGNPMGLDHSASVGIISGRGRGSLGLYDTDSYIDFLQTDADIAPGSSGGPLFDLNGRVVGITTAVGAGSGPGFAIPSGQARHVLDQLRDNGKVVRGWLGAGNEAERNAGDGALVGRVFANTPASEAGLRRGDVILEIDDEPVATFDELRKVIALTEPGHTVLMTVKRGGETVELTAVIQARPARDELTALRDAPAKPKFNLDPPARPTAPKASTGIGGRLGVSARPHEDGLEIVRVESEGVASDLDLQPGDVISSINGEAIRSPADVTAAMSRSREKIEVEMLRANVKHKVSLERS